MGQTLIEKIITGHSGKSAKAGDVVDLVIDARVARDFGGANVVKNIRDNGLPVAEPGQTFFTFDCNPGGSDQNYAKNQQLCRVFAREHGITVHDINAGIGTHLAIDLGLVGPGGTLVSTDSHANILGAIGAFGQGMGDQDIAHAFAHGTVWFKVPKTIKVTLKGVPAAAAPKDVTLALVRHFCANGLLGAAAEFYGPYVDELDLAGRATLASMCTEMGGIIMLFPPNQKVIDYCRKAAGREVTPVFADPDAEYADEVVIDIGGVGPLISRPGRPDDVVPVSEVAGSKVDSVFIGSCTNGRYEDLAAAAEVLRGRTVAPGVVLKIVPATDIVWRRLLDKGLVKVFKDAGALLGNAGCAGCAAGQIGQNGPGETTVSTGNRNFPGKQGKGLVYLASPQTAAASAVAGAITTADKIPDQPAQFEIPIPTGTSPAQRPASADTSHPTKVKGRAWVIRQDNIDTDMIYHNRHLTVTDPEEMKQYAFGNLDGWEDFSKKVRSGDIIVTGKNFGCGSSRQQAVDCFKALGVSVIVADSFGAIYERNAINAGLAVLCADVLGTSIDNGEDIEVDFESGTVTRVAASERIQGLAFPEVQLAIYRRGGLLTGRKD